MLQLLRLVSIRHLGLSPLRTLLTVFGVAVGVATLIGIAAINRSVLGAFRSTIDDVAGKADFSISAGDTGFDDALLETVKKHPGVLHSAGSLTKVASVMGSPGERLYVMGVDLLDDGFFRNYESPDRDIGQMSDDLEFINSTDRMLVSEKFAQSHGLEPGDTFSLLTAKGSKEFVIHGLLKETGPIKVFGGLVGVMYMGSAQVAFERDRHIDRIDVAVDPELDPEQVKKSLEATLGPQFEISRPERRGATVATMLRSFQLGLNAGSMVALLVGVFLVYNTIAIGVVQRRREIGVLRALGATRRRIVTLFALEAVVLGGLGSAIGVPLGTLLARAMLSGVSASVSAIYTQVSANPVTMTPKEMLVGIALGVTGSLIAALWPAFMASKVAPVEALRRDIASGAGTIKSWPSIVGVGLLLAAIPLSLFRAPIENMPVFGYAAMFCVLMATALLSPFVLRNLEVVYRRPSEAVLGISGRLASDNFSRAPGRTAVPVSALGIGVAMTICIAGFTGSFQKTSQDWIDQSVPADLFVTAGAKLAGVQNTPLKEDIFGDALEKIPGVTAVNPVRLFQHDVLGLRIFIISLIPEVYNTRAKPDVREGKLPTPEQRREGWLTVSENFARRRELHPGSSFELSTPTGVRTYRVAAVITDYTSDQGVIIMDRRIFSEHFDDHLVDSFQLFLDDPSRTEAIRDEINRRWGQPYDLFVLSNQDLRAEAHKLVESAFAITYAMEFLAVVLALLGVINTLLAAVLDRTREIGLLRAIGAARPHIIRLFSGEATLMGLTGGVLGCLAGYLLGYMVTKIVGVEGTGWDIPYIFPVGVAVQMLVVATLFAIIAGLYPARRASRLDVVEALAYE